MQLDVIEALQEKHTLAINDAGNRNVRTRRASRRYCALLDGPAQIYQNSPDAPHRSHKETYERPPPSPPPLAAPPPPPAISGPRTSDIPYLLFKRVGTDRKLLCTSDCVLSLALSSLVLGARQRFMRRVMGTHPHAQGVLIRALHHLNRGTILVRLGAILP